MFGPVPLDLPSVLERHIRCSVGSHGACSAPRHHAITSRIIKAAIEVHRTLGPGLFESVYLACLLHELREAGLRYETQKLLPVVYKGVILDCGFRLDLIVEGRVVVEVKSVDASWHPSTVHS